MSRSTLIILAVVVVGGFLVFAMTRSSAFPVASTSAPPSTLASIFTFGTKVIDAGEKALPHFFKDPDPTDANLGAYASSSGFASHDD